MHSDGIIHKLQPRSDKTFTWLSQSGSVIQRPRAMVQAMLTPSGSPNSCYSKWLKMKNMEWSPIEISDGNLSSRVGWRPIGSDWFLPRQRCKPELGPQWPVASVGCPRSKPEEGWQVFDRSKIMSAVGVAHLVIVACRAYVTGWVWGPGNAIDTGAVVIQPWFRCSSTIIKRY